VKYYDQAEVGVTRDATESGGNLTAPMTMYRAVGMGFYVTKAVGRSAGLFVALVADGIAAFRRLREFSPWVNMVTTSDQP